MSFKYIRKRRTKEYEAWMGMMRRCYRQSSVDYKYYGGRGIRVCRAWRKSFEEFLLDVGLATSPSHSLERLDNDGNYKPSNVVWATKKQQSRNKRNNHVMEVDGVKRTLAEWAELKGISRGTILTRIRQLGWDEKKAILTPKDETRLGNQNNRYCKKPE